MTRIAAATAAAALHAFVALLLVRAFAPALPTSAAAAIDALLTVRMAPPPTQTSPRPRSASVRASGAHGAPARTALARAPAALPPLLLAAPVSAPPLLLSVRGDGPLTGAGTTGVGSGALGTGTGSGAGRSGDGIGSGGSAARPVKIAGAIDSARDYPPASRSLRLGDHVIVALTVGVDGRVGDCRIVRPSRDPAADAITCRLATQRFRFRPARDASGAPIAATYGWKQRWFSPGDEPDPPGATAPLDH